MQRGISEPAVMQAAINDIQDARAKKARANETAKQSKIATALLFEREERLECKWARLQLSSAPCNGGSYIMVRNPKS